MVLVIIGVIFALCFSAWGVCLLNGKGLKLLWRYRNLDDSVIEKIDTAYICKVQGIWVIVQGIFLAAYFIVTYLYNSDTLRAVILLTYLVIGYAADSTVKNHIKENSKQDIGM